MLRRLLQRMFNQCVLCGLDTDRGRICGSCLAVLPWNHCYCDHCGQPLPAATPPDVACGACQRDPPPFQKARTPLYYRFPVDTALKKMKFGRQLAYAPAFAELLLPILRSEFADCDALVPVPLHRWRHVTRGFNQAHELCRPLAAASGLPLQHPARRIRATRSQSGLSAAARRKNLRKAFAVQGVLQCRRPLIVDDVITTGATCRQLAATLLDAGAHEVGVLAVAHSLRS